jgi:hypothetical protein
MQGAARGAKRALEAPGAVQSGRGERFRKQSFPLRRSKFERSISKIKPSLSDRSPRWGRWFASYRIYIFFNDLGACFPAGEKVISTAETRCHVLSASFTNDTRGYALDITRAKFDSEAKPGWPHVTPKVTSLLRARYSPLLLPRY